MKRVYAEPRRVLACVALAICLCSPGALAHGPEDHGAILENLGFPLTVDGLEAAVRSFHIYDSAVSEGDLEHLRHALTYIEEHREEEIAILMLPVLRAHLSEITQREYKDLIIERIYIHRIQMNLIACLFKVDLEMPEEELHELFERVIAVLRSKDPTLQAYKAFIRAGYYQLIDVREILLEFIREKTLDPRAPGYFVTKIAINDLFKYFAAGLTEEEIESVFEAFEDEPELTNHFATALAAYDARSQ